MTHTRSRLNTLGAFALTLVISGCGVGPFGPDNGAVRFVLSAGEDLAPAAIRDEDGTVSAELGVVTEPARSDDHDDDRERGPFFVSANVTFTSILARNYEGVLVNVEMDLPTTVDILSMEGGREVTLPDGDLAPGTYDQVVVVMSEVQGVTRDGTTITIDPPGGGWTTIVPICPFEVQDGATAVVGLQLSVRRSFIWRDNRFHFQPRFVCESPEDSATEG